MTAKVWTVNIQTVMVLPFESDRDLPPDEWPLRELLTRIIDQSTTGALDVDLTAIEWVLKCEPVSTQSTLPIVEQDDRSNVIEQLRGASCDEDGEGEEVLVMMQDPDRVCRAWARGPMPQIEGVRAEAQRQLELYRERKAEVGDPLATAVFTESFVSGEAVDAWTHFTEGDTSLHLPDPIDLKATPNLDRPKRIRSADGIAVIEFHYRSEGYTRLARGLNIGTAEPANGGAHGVWLTLAERTLIRAAHEDRYPKKSPASEAGRHE